MKAGRNPPLNEKAKRAQLQPWQVFAAQVFYLNWVLLLLNLLPAFPLDGGRALHCVLWWRSDYRQAMYTTAYAGFLIMLACALAIEHNLRKLGRAGMESLTSSMRNGALKNMLCNMGNRWRERWGRDDSSSLTNCGTYSEIKAGIS